MSTPTRQEIISLYRSYMRIVREWPSDKVRPNRGMKQILEKRVEETFRASNPESINMEKARKELDALESLLDNKFKDKVIRSLRYYSSSLNSFISQYPISDKILTPASNPNYYSKLVSSLEASKDGQRSALAKLFGK
jgi:hypothetical protein